jgi:hypothetical protein
MLLLVAWPYGLSSKPSLLKKTCAFHSMALMTIKKKLREFAKWILSIRNGEISDLTFLNDCDASLVKISSDLLLNVGLDLITIIVSTIYPSLVKPILIQTIF